jgi:hypothetical protein
MKHKSEERAHENEVVDVVSTDEFMTASVHKRIMDSKPFSEDYSYLS